MEEGSGGELMYVNCKPSADCWGHLVPFFFLPFFLFFFIFLNNFFIPPVTSFNTFEIFLTETAMNLMK